MSLKSNKKNPKSNKKNLQRIFVLVSGLAFLGSTVFILLQSVFDSSPDAPTPQTVSREEQLQARANGFEKVLEREPENPIALQGLVEIRLEMNDLEGAIEPMEQLVKLYPEQQQFQAMLAAMKQQLNGETQGNQEEENK